MALVSQPYLLLRIVQYFQSLSPLLMLSARVCMFVSWFAVMVASWFTPLGNFVGGLAIIIAFVLTDAYAMLVFVRGALTASGVVRNRLRLAASGSGLLALTLVKLNEAKGEGYCVGRMVAQAKHAILIEADAYRLPALNRVLGFFDCVRAGKPRCD
jgi:hypothetical protein